MSSIRGSQIDGKTIDDDAKPTAAFRVRQKRWQLWLPKEAPPEPRDSIDDAPDIPIATASLFSLLTYSWITPMMVLGWRRDLQIGDLWKVDSSRKSTLLGAKLEAAWMARVKAAKSWNSGLETGSSRPSSSRRIWWTLCRSRDAFGEWKRTSTRQPSLMWTLIDVFGREFAVGGFCKIVGDIAQLCGPLVSKVIIRYAQERAAAKKEGLPLPPVGKGIASAIGLFALAMIASICQHAWLWFSNQTGVLARASLISALFSRGLSLTPLSRTIHTKGALVNHLSTDISRIDYLFQWSHPAWTAPVQVVVCVLLLCLQLGPSALAGFSLFVLLTPIQQRAMALQLKMRRGSMKFTDQRSSMLSEILSSMEITKFFTYEVPFWNRVSSVRRAELRGIRTLLIMRAATQSVAFSIPVLASVLAFVVYALSGHDLNPAIIFTSLALFGLLRQPLMFMPRSLSAIIDGKNALERLSKVLLADAFNDDLHIDPELPYALQVKDASFQWEAPLPVVSDAKAGPKRAVESGDPTKGTKPNEDPFELHNIDLNLQRSGMIYAVVGPIGSGKSSLLQGLIGEMRRTRGTVSIGGQIAYGSQVPWIQNASLRDNILFGRGFETTKYWKVVADACLISDLELLPDGDLTEIGEKGINLSGGQKARVNLARALYSDADIIILDDPLSAVDAHVAISLWSKAILGSKERGKTVLLSTHALHFLPQADYVYYLSGGTINEHGSYEYLINSGGLFSSLIRDFGSAPTDAVLKPDETNKESDPNGAAAGTGKTLGFLMSKETRKTGSIKLAVYKSYIRAGGGWPVIFQIVFSGILMQASGILTSYWLVWWQERAFNGSQGFYMGVYAGLGLSQAVFTFALGGAMTVLAYLASNRVHGKSLRTLLHAPMGFFDSTPLGRILGTMTKDVDTIDNNLSDSLRMMAVTITSLLGSIILVSILFPYFLPIVCVILTGCTCLARFYSVSSREMKRLDAILRSSLYAHFSESLSGVATIRAYRATERFVAANGKLIDNEDSALLLTITNQRWLSIRLDVMGSTLTFAVALMAVFGINGVSPAQIGLSLTTMVSLAQILGPTTRQTTEVENNMNAVERLYQYSDEGSIPREAAYEATDAVACAPPEWPMTGCIDFKDVYLSYRPGLPPVLRGVNLRVNGAQKVGICGRTGAGKSTLTASLFRLLELSSGSIIIDDLDISKLGLHQLRSSISIIPQDPVCFSGTVRSNLDPFGQHDDARLWDALRRSHLLEGHNTRFTLDTVVETEGSNFSVGERSLLSLARALCKDVQIVIMDEATASVDMHTDSLIQSTILHEFKSKTLLCIAHRLRTIIGYEKILVLEQGRVAEFDTPIHLYDANGIFRSMCESSHIRREDVVDAVAWGGKMPKS